MALFHLHVTQVKRSAGQSVVTSAAYRAGEKLYSEYYGEVSDYTHKGGIRVGASWIAPEYYQQFMYELCQTPEKLRDDKIKLMYSDSSGEWRVLNKSADSKDNVRVHATYGTKRVNAYELFEALLNQRDVRVFDKKWLDGQEVRVLNEKETAIAQQKQEAIGEAFKDWIFKDPERREALCRKYNDKFNNIRPREYDGSHINFVGMNPEISLRTHQRNAVAHILYGKNTLLALPLMLALYTLHIIGKLVSNLSAYIVGLFMLVVLACGIYQVCVRDWLNVAILFGVETVCVALQFSAMLLVELAGEWAGSLRAFLHS